MKNNAFTSFEKISRKPKLKKMDGYRKIHQTDLYQRVVGFTCMVCGQMVSSDYMLSGVNNRNHCPYCLHSKHVDLHQAGDRLNACRSTMRPIGLAWKKSAQKYGSSRGELMIIHRCDGCHQISINRIAADDRSDLIQRLFQETIHLSSEGLQQLRHNGIQPVTAAHESEILASL